MTEYPTVDLRTSGAFTRQRGAALAISLVFLLLLTMFAITAVNTSTLEEKMAGNIRDAHIAFQSTESALRAAEAWLGTWTSRPPTSTTNPGTAGVWVLGAPGNFTDSVHDSSWWTANGVEYGVAGTQEIAEATADPRHVIEQRGFVPDSYNVGHGYAPQAGRYYYRVTGFGVGATPNSQALLQSSYVHRFR